MSVLPHSPATRTGLNSVRLSPVGRTGAALVTVRPAPHHHRIPVATATRPSPRTPRPPLKLRLDMVTVPFRYLHHLVTVPVLVGGIETTFVLDSGIGLTLVSGSVATLAGCERTGATYTGRRMSGQEVTIPLASLGSLVIGGHRREDLDVGIFDIAGLDGIGGFLSLDFFRTKPVTVDYPAGAIELEEADSLAARAGSGIAVDVRVEQDAHSTTVFLPLDVPTRGSISVEVDMGSDSLIVDEALAGDLGINLTEASTQRVDGRDETGSEYTRYFTQLRGVVNVTGAPSICQRDPKVMVQKIIYDGLVGDAFLRNFIVTYDLQNARMIFARPKG